MNPTNADRAERIYRAMQTYLRAKGGSEMETRLDIRDILTDIMHYCDEQGVDFEHEIIFSRDNYDAEVEA